jgi:probable phosphoglycerate mutase
MTTLILWRHAPTGYNLEQRLQGSLDIPLVPHGRAAARAAAERIGALYGPIAAVVSSPLTRAKQSAVELGAVARVDVVEQPGLTQRPYGEWEGLTWNEIQQRWPQEYDRRMQGLDPRIEGWGESAQVAERVGAALRSIALSGQTVVAVSHGSALTLGVADLVGMGPSAVTLGHLPHAAWNVLRQGSQGDWRIDGYALQAD